jgi:hypothetical protein
MSSRLRGYKQQMAMKRFQYLADLHLSLQLLPSQLVGTTAVATVDAAGLLSPMLALRLCLLLSCMNLRHYCNFCHYFCLLLPLFRRLPLRVQSEPKKLLTGSGKLSCCEILRGDRSPLLYPVHRRHSQKSCTHPHSSHQSWATEAMKR